MQRTDHAPRRHPVEQRNLLRAVVLVQEHHRLPALGAVLPVDPVGQVLHLVGQVAVGRQVRPARRADLEEVERPAQLRVLLRAAGRRARSRSGMPFV